MTARSRWLGRREAKLLFLSLVVVACREAASEKPDSVAESAPASARLSIAPLSHDFGQVVQGAVLRHSFGIVNEGATPVAIGAVGPVLGCSGRAQPAALLPGARGELAVTCTTEFHGPLRVSLPVQSNGGVSQEIQLTAHVLPLLSFDTPLLDMNLAYGEERTADLRLTGALARKARLQLKDAGTCGFDVRFPKPAPNETPQVRIVLKNSIVGTHVGNLVFTTGLERPAEVTLPYSCRVAGTLSVAPTNPYFNLRLPGPKAQVIEVKSSQQSFAIHSVEILDGPFAATAERAEAEGAYRVIVRVVEERLGETRGSVGTLRIRSNDRSELVKDVPLIALGRLNTGG